MEKKMGVDAEMFARIRGQENWLRDDQETRAGYELATTLGADNFLITRETKYAFGRPHHALSIVRPIKDAADAEYHGLDASFIGKRLWTQDGPDIVAEPDEQFIKVHLMTRYYGEDYARGNWPIIRATAEWLEWKFPGCEVWYGGDSSGICAAPLTVARRKQLNDFYLVSGHSTYLGGFGGIFERGGGAPAPVCATCEEPMRATGGGQDCTFWHCDGCDGQAISRGGSVQLVERGKDIMEVSREQAHGTTEK
jgi:hypothetical protein